MTDSAIIQGPLTSFKKMLDESPCAKITAIVAATLAAGAFTTATVYMGIYAFNSPDPNSCWVVRDLQMTARSKAEIIDLANNMNIDVTEGYPVEMHKIYIAWFLWGFYSKCAMLALMGITSILYFCAEKASIIVGSISCGLYVSNAIVWLSCGGIWRYSKAGVIAAGDKLERQAGVSDDDWEAQIESAMVRQGYQIEGGRFIKVYMISAAIFVGLALIILIVLPIVMSCVPSSKEGEKEMGGDAAPAAQEEYRLAPSNDEREMPRRREDKDRLERSKNRK